LITLNVVFIETSTPDRIVRRRGMGKL